MALDIIKLIYERDLVHTKATQNYGNISENHEI